MEIFVWFYHFTIPLLGWWLLTTHFQKLAVRLQTNWNWNSDFKSDFLKSFLITFVHATPEHHLRALKESPLSLRLRLLWLGLRSLSYGFIFLVLFGIWSFVPPAVALLLGLVTFVVAQWWKPLRGVSLFFLGLGLFLFGFENLMQASSRLTESGEASSWVYELARNYFTGALLGAGVGAAFRLVFRMSGLAWWSGMNLLLSGILSLGGAWGFFLGEFLVAVLEDFLTHRERDFQWRSRLAFGFGVFMLFLTTPFQSLVMDWMNGQYSVYLRGVQLAFMIFVFLFLESVLSLSFFHFYYLKKRSD